MKIGDKLICKSSIPNIKWGGDNKEYYSKWFIVGKKYELSKFDSENFSILVEKINPIHGGTVSYVFSVEDLKEYFYTVSEYRKIKLSKLETLC